MGVKEGAQPLIVQTTNKGDKRNLFDIQQTRFIQQRKHFRDQTHGIWHVHLMVGSDGREKEETRRGTKKIYC
jgi:hypothetical protein